MLADRVPEVATALREAGFDAWFLQDFHGHNPIATQMLGLDPEHLATRRAAVCIHADGTVRTLSHRIEQSTLAHWSGERFAYSSYLEYAAGVAALVRGATRIACEYSEANRNPYLSYLDGGTVDLLRRSGEDCDTVLANSGELVQHFSARLTAEQVDQYERSVAITTRAFELVRGRLADIVRTGQPADERDIETAILDHFESAGLDPDHPPIVAVGPNSGLPHYATGSGESTTIRPGDLVLVDLWGKLREPGAVFSDFTRMFFLGERPPQPMREAFETIAAARDLAIERLRTASQPLAGAVLDQVARSHIATAFDGRYVDAFSHRLGHSITTELHGSGAHLDSHEVIETRPLVPGLLFSVEPGIYTPGFGVRTEVNVRIDDAGQPVVYAGGPIQTAIECVA